MQKRILTPLTPWNGLQLYHKQQCHEHAMFALQPHSASIESKLRGRFRRRQQTPSPADSQRRANTRQFIKQPVGGQSVVGARLQSHEDAVAPLGLEDELADDLGPVAGVRLQEAVLH